MVLYPFIGESLFDWIAEPFLRGGDAAEIPSHLSGARDNDICKVDLSRARWVGPATIVGLAAFLDRETRTGRSAVVSSPENFDLACYLSRMGMGRLLDEMRITHDFPVVRADPKINARALVELGRFRNESDVTQIIELLTYRDLPDELRDVMCTLISEMGNNVPQHAQVEHGYIAAQVINDGATLRLAVADTGVGMLATLRPRDATTDMGALKLALAGVSESTEPGRGRGIPAMRSAIGDWGGQAVLLSGGAMARVTSQRDAYWAYPGQRYYPGTVFDAALPLRTPARKDFTW